MLTAGSGTNIKWFTSLTGDTVIGSGMIFSTPVLTSDTTYYYGEVPMLVQFKINTLLTTNASVTDHYNSGRDRGGIAVTKDYIYYVGYYKTVRFNAPALTNPAYYDKRDGIFSDLSTGILYTLWNGTNDPVGPSLSSVYTVSSLRSLNTDMTLGSDIINLSSSIAINGQNSTTNQTGIFAGYGFLILHSPVDNKFYHIDISNGQVSTLGTYTFPHAYSSNWAYWGIGEFDGSDYSVVYVANNTTISRINTSTGTINTVGTFTNLGNMACITYSPWNSRWYFHHRYGSQFGGSLETLGYADGVHTTLYSAPDVCRTAVNVTVIEGVNADAGNDVTICSGDSIQLNATGGTSYNWSPVTGLSNPNIANPLANPATTTTYHVNVTNMNGCMNKDSVVVNVTNVLVANAGPDSSICAGNNVALNGSGGGGLFLESGSGVKL